MNRHPLGRRGSTATEYALIAALLGAGLAIAIGNLGAVVGVLHQVVATLASAAL